MGTPYNDTYRILHQHAPAGIAILTVATALHIETSIHIECRTSKALRCLYTCSKTALAPVVVEEVYIGYRLICSCVVEPVLVVAVELTSVVRELTAIGNESIPIDMERMVKFLGNLVALGQEWNKTVIHCIAPITLRVQAKTINTVVLEELDKLA